MMKQTALLILFSVLISGGSFGNPPSEGYHEKERKRIAAENHYHQGMMRAEAGMLEEADKKLSEALRLNPNLADAYKDRGAVRLKLNNPEGALEDLNQALKIAPSSEGALLNRGVVWTAMEDYEKAKKDFEAVLRLNPNSINALYNQGNAHVKLGQEFHLAVADYQRVLDLDPHHEGARNNLTITRRFISQQSERCFRNFTELANFLTPPEPPPMSFWDFLNPFKKR